MAPRATGNPPSTHLVAGGCAGLVEATLCHPLDTVKTRTQLSSAALRAVGVPGVVVATHQGPWEVAMAIVRGEGPLALYRGLSAVACGIVPKMAIRFWAFETYKGVLGGFQEAPLSHSTVFISGLLAGVTEAVLVVTPFEVCKIRMQAAVARDSAAVPRHGGNVVRTARAIAKEEGVAALWKGVGPTLLRQGINQAVNFTAYQAIKGELSNHTQLLPHHHFLIGGLSGSLGPIANCPLDVVKTRMQRQVTQPGLPPKYAGVWQSVQLIASEEGVRALWKGLTPRLMRIVPGQAITFTVYEAVAKRIRGGA